MNQDKRGGWKLHKQYPVALGTTESREVALCKDDDPMLPNDGGGFMNSLDNHARRFVDVLRATVDRPYELYFTGTGAKGDLRIRSSRDSRPFVLLTLVWQQKTRLFTAQLRCQPGSCSGYGFLTVDEAKDSQMRTEVTFNTDTDNIKKLIDVLPACVAAL